MKQNRRMAAGMALTAVLLLSACSGQSAALAPTTAPTQGTVSPAVQSTVSADDTIRTNSGGAVTFEVEPLNLGSGGSTLDFDVAMNTHSVDLGFDLKSLSVLKTDTGAEIAPSAYQGGSGHHVTGKLSFQANKLVGAKTLMLIIKNVAGVAERTFTWNLQ